MGSINSWFWRHAYLLQFTDKDGKLKDSFAFSMPPESESIQTTQRVSYTKTFGGIVVDDYGNDVTKISLSGTTGNRDMKVIYRGSLGFKMLNGEQEILYLNDLIKKYGKYANLDNKQVWLYDLSKTSGLSLVSSTKNYWRVYIDSFKYSRDKSMPLSYKYQLEMTAIDSDRKNSIADKFAKLSDFIKKAQELADDAIAIANSLQSAIGDIVSQIGNFTSVLAQTVQKFKDCYETYVSLVQGVTENVNGAINEITNLGEYIINDTVREIQDSAINLYVAASDVCASCVNLADYAESGLSNEAFDGQWEQVLNEYSIDSKDSFDDLVKIMADKLRVDGYEIKSETKGQVEVSEKDGVVYYGVSAHTVEQGETFESMSIKFYGTADYAEFLQSVNGASNMNTTDTDSSSAENDNDNVVRTGSVIKIPVLKESSQQSFPDIIKAENDFDSFGKDIKAGANGDFATANGDFSVTGYGETLNQAITARLSTAAGAKIRDSAYGIKSEIGVGGAVNAYLTASIEKTVLEDERVESVDSIQYEGKGDSLNYTVAYTAKNSRQYQVNGEI